MNVLPRPGALATVTLPWCASAALRMAQRGHRVTVFDRGGPPADDAASADRSKALRFEYGAHCDVYVPLVEESREFGGSSP